MDVNKCCRTPPGMEKSRGIVAKMQTYFAVCCASNIKKNLPASTHSNPVSIRTKNRENNFDIREVLLTYLDLVPPVPDGTIDA